MTENNCINHHEVPFTQAHRKRAAFVMRETGERVETWIETGEVDPRGAFNEDLVRIAESFASFEYELLSPPTTIVYGMEETDEICTLCGTSPEDGHTIRDCFVKYKAAQDDAAAQVNYSLSIERSKELAEALQVAQSYDRLASRWEGIYTTCIDAFRTELEMPDASLPEMLSAIEHLRRPRDQVMHVFWDEESIYVVARTCEDAALVYAEAIGEEVTFDSLEWSRFPDDQPLRIKCYGSDHPGAGTIAPTDEEGPHIVLVTRPAIEWAHRQGRGFLCTTDY